MISIVLQDAIIKSIIGVQKKNSDAYRCSRFVLRKDAKEGELLYHTLTCELIFLSPEETDESVLDELISRWFYVPEESDDYAFARKVKRLRQLVYRADAKKKMHLPTERYWILTTTNCNAHCFYCHEHGIPPMHMSQQTARDVVQYIEKQSAKKQIHIMWYGGEPLINTEIIDTISAGIREKGIEYASSMISNGFAFDAPMVQKAVDLWCLKEVQITLDGLEATYNKVKSYSAREEGSPFYRVLNNITLLLENSVNVKIRLNIDSYNAEELSELADLLIERFKEYSGFSVYSAPLMEDCLGTTNKRSDLQRQQVYEAHYCLSEKLGSAGVLFKTELARAMRSEMRCIAVSNVKVIFPQGQLAFCHDYAQGVLSGSIYEEEPEEKERMEYTKCLPEKDECRTCVKYPQCVRLEKCFNNKCNKEMIQEWIWKTQNEMLWEYEQWIEDGKHSTSSVNMMRET